MASSYIITTILVVTFLVFSIPIDARFKFEDKSNGDVDNLNEH